MDTSEKYIEMCEKAGEIQQLRKKAKDWDKGDWYHHLVCGGNIHVVSMKLNTWDITVQGSIWLPRQDQLQEIWMKHPEEHSDDARFEAKMDAFIYWLWGETFKHNFYLSQYHNFPSMEQLWLAFVMEEKYNKTWDGKEWVK